MASNISRASTFLNSSPIMEVCSSFDDNKYNLCEGLDQNIKMEDLSMRKSSITLTSRISQQSLLRDDNRVEDPWFLKFSGWFMEIISLMVAIFIITSVVVLLRYYDGKAISETPSRPSLNTIVTILSMAFSAMVMGAVTSALSQSKWSRYTTSHLLDDMVIIDEASRGPRGAMLALFHPHLGPYSILGAIIVLSIPSIGPAFQETLANKPLSSPDPHNNATISIAQSYYPDVTEQTGLLDSAMKAAVFDGLLYPPGYSSAVPFKCVTGNCTFASPYMSLAVCHKCEHIAVTTLYAADSNNSKFCNYTLPDGHALISAGEEQSVINATTATGYNALDVLDIASVSIISLTNTPDCSAINAGFCMPRMHNTSQPPVGANCSLQFCLKYYTSNIVDNSLDEKTFESSGSQTQSLYLKNQETVFLLANPCYINGISYTFNEYTALSPDTPGLEIITFPEDAADTNINTTGLTFPINCMFTTYTDVLTALDGFINRNEALFDNSAKGFMSNGSIEFQSSSVGIQPLFNAGNASFESLDSAFENLAAAMTSQIRQSADPASTFNITAGEGLLLRVQIIVTVTWYWLAIPASILLCACIYVMTAILQSTATARNMGQKVWKWKSNPLALLMLPVSSKSLDLVEPLSSKGSLDILSKNVKVRLQKTSSGWELVEDIPWAYADAQL